MAGQDWSDAENDALVASYFAMLAYDLRNEEPPKAKIIRDTRSILNERSEKSIEYKLRNVSAVFNALELEPVKGLKMLSNFQGSLADAVYRFLSQNESFILDNSRHRPIANLRRAAEPEAFRYDLAPRLRNSHHEEPDVTRDRQRVAQRIDIGALDAANRALGQAGEKFAFEFERLNLKLSGRNDLAERVDWVSQSKGDGLGYDILSFEPDGRERLIEVKTTNGWERTPFHITRNELAVAEEHRESWVLARLYNFAREPRGFEIRPPLEHHVALSPTTFLASLH